MRIAKVKLCDPSQLLPMPDRGGRLFRAGGETVDVENAFWLGLLGQGAIEEVKSAPAAAAPESEAAPEGTVPAAKAVRGRT